MDDESKESTEQDDKTEGDKVTGTRLTQKRDRVIVYEGSPGGRV